MTPPPASFFSPFSYNTSIIVTADMPYFTAFIPTFTAIQTSANELALVLFINGAYTEAYRAWKEAYLRRHNRLPASTHDACWTKSLDLMAAKLHLVGRPADAEDCLKETIREKERCLGEGDKRAGRSRLALGRALVAQGR
jgi:hypothetical protein